MILMGENPFWGPLEGVGPENQNSFGPWNGNERGECHLGPKKSRLKDPCGGGGGGGSTKCTWADLKVEIKNVKLCLKLM